MVALQLVARLSKDLLETYQVCNPEFKYSQDLNPKRFLTTPSLGVLNDGSDNANSDLILTVNCVLINFEAQRRSLTLTLTLSLSLLLPYSKQAIYISHTHTNTIASLVGWLQIYCERCFGPRHVRAGGEMLDSGQQRLCCSEDHQKPTRLLPAGSGRSFYIDHCTLSLTHYLCHYIHMYMYMSMLMLIPSAIAAE